MEGGGLSIPIGTAGNVFKFDADAMSLRLGLDARIGIFDIFEIETGFDLEFELPKTGSLFPSLNLSALGDLVPDMSGAPEFLKSAVEYVKNLDIAIGYDPNFGLNLLGSLEMPDMTLELGDFVHFQGDFKLSFGQTFVGTMYTGLPAEMA